MCGLFSNSVVPRLLPHTPPTCTPRTVAATGSTAYTPNDDSSRSPRWPLPRRRIPPARLSTSSVQEIHAPVSTRWLGAAYAWRPHMRSNSAMCAHIASGALNVLTMLPRRGPFQPIYRWSKPQWLRQMRGLVLDFAATATKSKGIGSVTKVCGEPTFIKRRRKYIRRDGGWA
jgi:hypothetical protein